MITRRATLAAGAAAAFLPAPAASLAANGSLAATGSRAAALVAALRYPASAVAVGTAYLKAFSMDAGDAEHLVDAISSDDMIRRRLDTHRSDPDGLALAIAEAVRADFVHRRTVKLDGWVVARTEARLCALAALV